MFQRATNTYQQALKESGYDHKLTYEQATPDPEKAKNKRTRNITWYNPPYSCNVKTNIGKLFLKLIDSEFTKVHPLRKICNRNTLKISYSCMSNVERIIDGHNKAVLKKQSDTRETPMKKCNCRKPEECPLSGECLAKSIIYQATLTSDNGTRETYVGLTEGAFKTRYSNHKASFKNIEKRNATELSNFVWQLKEKGRPVNITWKILKFAQAYNNNTRRCSLCLYEKYFIICKPSFASLNKRYELVTTCRHSSKCLLKNAKQFPP